MNDFLTENFSLDKSKWVTVKFGDVTFEPKESVKDIFSEVVEHVVGLEHIDSEDMHIRRSASIEDGTTFTKKFSSGDVLFGRRRAYLKKAAQAKFSGICSGDIIVMRARDSLLPQLLPFIVNNEKFFNYAITHSAGGLSPRVKFKDLAQYEFLLPPKEQQTQLSEILWAMDNMIEKDYSVLSRLITAKNAFYKDKVYAPSASNDFHFGSLSSRHKVVKLSEVITDLQYGISESLSVSGEVPVLRMNNLNNGVLSLNDLKYYTPSSNELDKFILDKGDILFNRTNSFDLVGKVSLFDAEDKYTFASYLIRIKTNRELLEPRYLNFYMNSTIGLSKIRKYRTPGVSQCNINAQNLKNLGVPLPDIDFQKDLMYEVSHFEKSEQVLSLKIFNAKKVQKSLIEEVF